MKSPEQNDVSGIALSLLILLSFALPVIESYISRRNHIFNRLNKKINEIDGDKFEPSHKDLVYYYTHKMQYSHIKDPQFGFSHQCAKLERNVQYCQWVEIVYPEIIVDRKTNKTSTTFHYKYYKKWLHTPIKSFFFRDPIYNNPRVTEIPETSFRSKHTRAGAYKIGTDIEYNGRTHHFTPSSSQIRTFEEKKQSNLNFQYAGKGIFYSPYKEGLLDQLLRVAQFFDLKGETVSWCTPGDRRVWYETWDNEDATIVGQRDNDTIWSFDYKGYKIGSISPGRISSKELTMMNLSSFASTALWSFRFLVLVYFILSFDESVKDYFGGFFLIACAFMGNHFAFKIFGSIVFGICCTFVSMLLLRFEVLYMKRNGIQRVKRVKIEASEESRFLDSSVNNKKSEFSFGEFANNVILPGLQLYMHSTARRPRETEYNDDINGSIDNFVENDNDRNASQGMRNCRNRKAVIYEDDDNYGSSKRQRIIVDDVSDDDKNGKDRFQNDSLSEL